MNLIFIFNIKIKFLFKLILKKNEEMKKGKKRKKVILKNYN